MNRKSLLSLAAWLLGIQLAAAQGTAFTYQGRLNDGVNPANGHYDFQFQVFDTGGTAISGVLAPSYVPVSNGLFTVVLDFGAGIFTGPDRWLQINARTNGITAFGTLSPRQKLTPSPYAIYAATASNVVAGSINNTALAVGAVNSSSIADGSIASGDLSPTLLSNTFWRLTGNAGTTSGVNFLGTPDNVALEFRVNNARAMRIEPGASASPNVIGGSAVNYVQPGSRGNFIGGGRRWVQHLEFHHGGSL